ncbi:MAG: DUF2948 family protein [Alphaproteobacteria bacterium]
MDKASVSTSGLRLRATSAEDTDVISTLMQDAIIRVRDIKFLKNESRFVGMFNRFRWELRSVELKSGELKSGELSQVDAAYEDAAYEDVGEAELDALTAGERQRAHAGLCLEHVTNVRSKNFPNDKPEAFMNLLSIISGDTSTTFLFADHVSIQVQHKKLDMFVEDFGEAWPTTWQPNHPEENG